MSNGPDESQENEGIEFNDRSDNAGMEDPTALAGFGVGAGEGRPDSST